MTITQRLTRVSVATRSRLWRFSFHSALQVLGQVVPLVIAVIAIRVVQQRVSPSDFGVFSLALTALGFFAVMDLGLGRATVRFISPLVADGNKLQIRATLLQSGVLLGGFSVVLSLVFVLFIAPAAGTWLQAPPATSQLARHVVYILAVSVPFIGLTSVLRSFLEAKEAFPTIALAQASVGSLTYAAPLALSLITDDVRLLIAGAVFCRILGFALFAVVARDAWSKAPPREQLKTSWNSHFLQFSGWLIVSNVVGNVIVYADRALLSGIIPLAELPYYNVPLEILTRVMIIVNGAITVAFPYLSRIAGDNVRLERIHAGAVSALGAVIAPLLLIGSVLAPLGLELWLGALFRLNSTEIVRIFLVGLMFLSLNAFALASLNARGLARSIAIMHVVQAPIYLWALSHFGESHGLTGIAIVWSARMAIEYVCYSAIQIATGESRRNQSSGVTLGFLHTVPLTLFALSHQTLLAVALCVVTAGVTIWWAVSVFRSARLVPVSDG